MDALIIHSLKAVQNVMINDRHCFECYGYDILIDADLKPWLVEVNASPSLTTTTEADRIIKLSLLRDIYNVVAPGLPATLPENAKTLGIAPSGPCYPVGGFYVLYDEAQEAADAAAKEDEDDSRFGRSRRANNRGSGKQEWR